jgi:hypothetical protein
VSAPLFVLCTQNPVVAIQGSPQRFTRGRLYRVIDTQGELLVIEDDRGIERGLSPRLGDKPGWRFTIGHSSQVVLIAIFEAFG